MRSLNQQELLTVSGAGTTDTSTRCTDKAAKLAAIKAKVAEMMKKHAAKHHGVCKAPTTTPTDTTPTDTTDESTD